MGSLTAALLLLQLLDPDLVLALWFVGCMGALFVGSGIAFYLRGPVNPVGRPQRQPRHAAGRNDQAADDTVRRGPRHQGIGEQVWRPAHTYASLRHRGRHHVRRGRWAAPLINKLGEQTGEITAADLAKAMGRAA